jgi:hypothetical protein
MNYLSLHTQHSETLINNEIQQIHAKLEPQLIGVYRKITDMIDICSIKFNTRDSITECMSIPINIAYVYNNTSHQLIQEQLSRFSKCMLIPIEEFQKTNDKEILSIKTAQCTHSLVSTLTLQLTDLIKSMEKKVNQYK